MKETGVAIRYALAIYDIAVENNKVLEINETLDSLLNLYEKDKEFKNLMLHPLIKREEKKKIANGVFSDADETSKNIIDYLIDKDRMSIIRFIATEYLKNYYKENNEISVTATFPKEINEEQRKKLLQKLENKTRKKVVLDIKIDNSIIGGGIVRINDDVIDGSIKRQMENIKNTF